MSTSTIAECITRWKKTSGRGSDILRTAAAQRDGSFNYIQDLLDVVNELRGYLENMYLLFDEHLQEKQMAFHIQAEKGDEGGINDYTSLYMSCLDMLDQDYIMKQTIQAILNAPEGSAHPQHLIGFSSVWTCEPYIDNKQIDTLLQQAA
ncbi:hypothetical protein BC943DRAFT_363725 [Umbelopsis sp. AD052]|nr:hypothetical protein BC943DRAFT_363725 [Umbelopsis sp. AD052]